MKQLFILTLALFFTISHGKAASWYESGEQEYDSDEKITELGIELVTCTPDGIINMTKARFNPKEFWIKQHIALEDHIEHKYLYNGSECRQGDITDAEKAECLSISRNLYASIVKCCKTAKLLCRK